MVPSSVIGRLLFEISADCNLPPRIYACAMLMYHAFMEYVSEDGDSGQSLQDVDSVMVGITSLILSVKFNENYLNTVEKLHEPTPTKSRSMRVIESAAHAIVSYSAGQVSSSGISTEQFVLIKERIKNGVSEMSMLRIFGNFTTSIPIIPGTDTMETKQLIREYSTSQCLSRISL